MTIDDEAMSMGIQDQMGDHYPWGSARPRMEADKTYEPLLDDYDAFTTLRLDSYTGDISGCCSASAPRGRFGDDNDYYYTHIISCLGASMMPARGGTRT